MNLASIIDGHPADRVALVDGAAVITYAELRHRVASAASAFVALGAQPGQSVGIVVPNGAGFVAAYLGALHAGLVAVPLNPQSPRRELESELSRVEPFVVAAPVTLAEDLAAAVGAHGLALDAGLPAAGDLLPAAVDAPADRLAALLFTSGTAGTPRPAMLTHGNLLANIDQVRRHPGGLADRPRVTLGILPFHHIFGLNTILGITLAVGGTLVTHDGFDPERVARDLVEHRVDVVAGTPSLWVGLLECSAITRQSMGGVHFATSGAAHLPTALADRALAQWGIELRQGYGLTEASPVVASAVGTTAPAISVGRPLPGVEVRLVDDGEDALVDDEGELWVRGPNVFAGYWNDDAATRAAMTPDGWLRTGDIGVVDGHGHVHLVDRAKDLIIVSGFNVHPTEVEDMLCEHPAVADAGVVGAPDPKTGETVVAHVVIRSGMSVSPDELRSFARDRLARYKCPTRIETIDAIPRSPSGKILHRQLGRGPVA